MKTTKKIKAEEKSFPPINGAAIQQTETTSSIARKIERYLNTCGLCLRVEEAEKLSQFEKEDLGDIIWTLGDAPNKASEIIEYFKRQLKIKVEDL